MPEGPAFFQAPTISPRLSGVVPNNSPLTSFIRAIDPGGMVWEGKDEYKTLDQAFQDLEEGLGRWMREAGIE